MRKLFTRLWHYYILCGLFFIALVIWLPDSGYDKYFWVSWAKYIHIHGLRHAYDNPEINYHPVILFIINIFTWCVNDINYTTVNWLKVPTALFDWGIVFIALSLLKQTGKNLQWGLLLAFNPAFWYNTVIWGQFDSIWVFFVLLAFYMAGNKQLFYSVAAFVMAINTKIFAVFFLPFLVIIYLTPSPSVKHLVLPLRRGRVIKTPFPAKEGNELRSVWKSIVAGLIIQIAILLPFLFSTNYSLPAIIQRSTDYYHSLSRNAYNIWYYLFDNPVTTNDTSYMLPAAVFVGIIFIALLYLQYKQKITVWQAVAMASLSYFFFLTRMHERYAHAAMVFSIILFSLTPQPPLSQRGGAKVLPLWGEGFRMGAIFVLLSLAYFLNLEAVMQTANKSLRFNVNYNSILFNPKLVATLYLIACLLLAYTIFLQARKPLGAGIKQ